MYNFKLLDIVLQSAAFLSAMVLLIAFGAFGYFFWIKVCLIIWIFASMILNFLLSKSISKMRKITTLMIALLFFVFLISYLLGVTLPRLNFYFQPLSIVIIFVYLFISFFELNKMKGKGEIDLDF